ncbi:histone PARylation factor 1 isoform X1 [Centropristis striata]|uniref:histone PARylation factor 1 isoform X1 n=2 Tax=Centropristis striata TaxID=184440 RepID=UPI0027E14684|nr:histone PARylation factor 1 isoform X1 [Centropristis striata]
MRFNAAQLLLNRTRRRRRRRRNKRKKMTGRAKRKPKSSQDSGTGNGELKKARTDESKAVPLSEVDSEQRDEMVRLYKLQMPEDLYHFWDFCKELCPDSPRGALKDTLGLQLVGPFDILAGAHKNSKNPQPNFHLHWRYLYDPPEFQTILLGSEETQHHIGYFRDTPDSLPAFVGENEAKKSCTITQMGDNVFAAVLSYLLKRRKEKGSKKAEALESLEAKLRDRAEALGLSLEQKTKGMKQRDKKVVTKTFHGAGIVVPVDKNDVGYRELPETDAGLKKILKAIAEARNDEERVKAFGPLQEMITFVQFANDECDYGMGYELGMDLFCYGSHYFHKVIRQLLPMAYSLLKRNVFGEILEAHLSSRSHDNLDQLSAH